MLRCPNLDDFSMELWMQQSPRQEQPWNTETALFSWMLPSPADGRWYVPRNPTGAVMSFHATPGEIDVTPSSFLMVHVVVLHL